MINFRVDDLKQMSERLKNFAESLRGFGVAEEDVFASRLVSSELLSNVLLHGGESADFECGVEDGRICIQVFSASFCGVNLNPPPPDVLAETGRGMYIVRCLCFGEIERNEDGIKVYIKRH